MQVITKEIIMNAVEGQEVAVFDPDTLKMVPCYFQRCDSKLFLTTSDSRIAEHNKINREGGVVGYGDYIKHVRLINNTAVMTREEMCEAIESRLYVIG